MGGEVADGEPLVITRAHTYINARMVLEEQKAEVRAHKADGEHVRGAVKMVTSLGHRAVAGWHAAAFIRAYNTSEIFVLPEEQGVLPLAGAVLNRSAEGLTQQAVVES